MAGIFYLNGHFVNAHDVSIDPSDRGFTLGDGVFDTMLAMDGVPLYADAHFERMARHAAVLQLTWPVLPTALPKIAAALLEKNSFARGRQTIRTMLTRGPGARGLKTPDNPRPTLMMQVTLAPPVIPDVTAIVAQSVKRNEGSALSCIKSLNYGDQILALQEAAAKGADDAIILNNQGRVCCASAGNVFVNIDGVWVTPPLSDGVLDGITRDRILAEGLARERAIDAGQLARAKGIFISNSVIGIRPVRALDGRALDIETPEISQVKLAIG